MLFVIINAIIIIALIFLTIIVILDYAEHGYFVLWKEIFLTPKQKSELEFVINDLKTNHSEWHDNEYELSKCFSNSSASYTRYVIWKANKYYSLYIKKDNEYIIGASPVGLDKVTYTSSVLGALIPWRRRLRNAISNR